MIPKGTNVVVNFYATDSAGVPLSRASGITPYYRLNGGDSDPLACNIYSLGTDAPGWFRFSTSHFNTSVGNLFITFSNNSGYIIMPWEDDIVPTGGASAADIWNYSFSGSNASSYLYATNISADDAAYYAQSVYSKVSNIGTSFSSIPNSVWNYGNGTSRIVNNTIPSASDIAIDVWDYTIKGSAASVYLGSISGLATTNNITTATNTITGSIGNIGGWATPANVTAATNTITTSIGNIGGWATSTDITNATNTITGSIGDISIPTPPTTDAIATSVWGHTIGGSSASVYLGSISGLATTTNITNATNTITTSIGTIGGWATPANVTDATNTITGSIANIDIPTPPTAGDIATSVWDHTWAGITASTRIDNMSSNIEAMPTTEDITSSVWGNSSGVRSLNNSFYGDGTDSRFAVKNDIQALPGGLTAEDVWNYKIVNNISARTYLTAISTSAASIPGINTSIGTINTSITSINGSIGSINNSVTSINGNIGNINTSVASINGSIGTINTSITSINSGIGSLNSTVAYLDAGLFNWRISTNKLITSVSNTEVEYTVSRDINSNIIGIRPVQ